MDSRKKPGVAFWATVVVVVVLVVLIAYPLAYGPWIGYSDKLPKPIQLALNSAFEPIRALHRNGYVPQIYESYVVGWLLFAIERAAEDDGGDFGGSGSGPHRTLRLRSQDAARR